MSARRIYWSGMIACIVFGRRRAAGTERRRGQAGTDSGPAIGPVVRTLDRLFPGRLELTDGSRIEIDLGREQSRFTGPEAIVSVLRNVLVETTGGEAAIGLAADRTCARMAASLPCPGGGARIVPPWQARSFLQWLPVADVLDLGPAIKGFLDHRGIVYCGQMRHLSMAEMRRRFGRHGVRLWCASQGRDPGPAVARVSTPDSVGLGKLLPPATRDPRAIESALEQVAKGLAGRLRALGLAAHGLEITLETASGPLRCRQTLDRPSATEDVLAGLCRTALWRAWDGQAVSGVHLQTRGRLSHAATAMGVTSGAGSGT